MTTTRYPWRSSPGFRLKARSDARRGFSLLELLVVIAIIVLLFSFSLPAFQTIIMGNALARGGQMVGSLFALARQEAVSRNREVWICFYHFPDGPGKGWRSVQIFRIDPDPVSVSSTTIKPVTRPQTLPDGIIIAGSNPPEVDDALSPILAADLISPSVPKVTFPDAGTSDIVVAVRFKPNGSTCKAFDAQHGFLTLQYARDTSATPVNYYTLQLDPLVGKITVYRP